MSARRYSQDQILKVLKEIEDGATMASVARTHGIGIYTIYEWRRRYAGMTKTELTELKSLQEENRKLRRIVANMALDIEALKELQRGKW